MSDWLWRYSGYEPAEEGDREALCTLGNGYTATRGACPESPADDVHYPGSYVAGVFNRLASEVAGRVVENESLVRVPNWLPVRLAPVGGRPFTMDDCTVLDHQVELDMRRGVLTRHSRLEDDEGRILSVTQRRIVSLRDPNVMALETTWVAVNWSGLVEITSELDGTVQNVGVPRYAAFDSDHLTHVSSGESVAPGTAELVVCTNGSRICIAQCARLRTFLDGQRAPGPLEVVASERHVSQHGVLELAEGQELTLEKVVAMATGRDRGIYEPRLATREAVAAAGSFDELLARHASSWSHAWNRNRIELTGDVGHTSRVLNLHIFHLLQTTSKNTAGLDVGVPARGLHGEAYRGHIFWDELYIFPFLNLRIPEVTRSLLHYRARRLERARLAALEAGYAGAMFPWQSGSDGREETQIVHLNPRSGRWLPDASHLQRHINAAIAFNVWNYWQVSADQEFMRFWGAEMILEIARFWSSIATYRHADDRYEINGVMGPDEYHEAYPWADEPGLDNNAYTNVMAVWCLMRAFDTLEALPNGRSAELREKLALTNEDLRRWKDITHKMRLCFHGDRILSQFEGYERLEELDWDGYRTRYGDIGRLDRILEAEGDSPNRYKLSKQADALLLFYVFSPRELAGLFDRLGYDFDDDFVRRNTAYYEARTSHGSTLSKVVTAWIQSRLDRESSWKRFQEALAADIDDVQGGTTREGIHLGAMAGTVDLIQRCYAGIETRQDVLFLDPVLPAEVESLHFSVRYRGQSIDLRISTGELTARVGDYGVAGVPVVLDVRGERHDLLAGDTVSVEL